MIKRVSGTDGHVAKEAEAHGRLTLGMVARRADGAEGTGCLANHDGIDGAGKCASRAPCGGQSARRHVRIGIERAPAPLRRGTAESRDMGGGMDPQDIIFGTKRGRYSEKVEPFERIQHGVKPSDLFGVARRRDMAKAIGVCDKGNGHGCREQDAASPHKGAVMLRLRNPPCRGVRNKLTQKSEIRATSLPRP